MLEIPFKILFALVVGVCLTFPLIYEEEPWKANAAIVTYFFLVSVMMQQYYYYTRT